MGAALCLADGDATSSSTRRARSSTTSGRTRRETANRFARAAARVAASCAGAWPRPSRRPPPPAAAAPVDTETAERLPALGYVSGGVPASVRWRATSRTQGRHQPHAAAQSRHVRGPRRPGARHQGAHRGVEEDPESPHGAGARAPSRTPPPDATSSPSPTCASSRKRSELTPEDEVVLGDNLRSPAGPRRQRASSSGGAEQPEVARSR